MSMISEQIEELRLMADMFANGEPYGNLLRRAADTIEMLSEKAREQKQGEWLHVEGQLGLACSKCGKMCNEITLCEDMVTKANWKYCPQCGSRMEGADDE